MTAKRPYLATCSGCGRERWVEQAWAARHMNAGQTFCLACTRHRNGWQHKPGCTDPTDWDHSPCPVAPESHGAGGE